MKPQIKAGFFWTQPLRTVQNCKSNLLWQLSKTAGNHKINNFYLLFYVFLPHSNQMSLFISNHLRIFFGKLEIFSFRGLLLTFSISFRFGQNFFCCVTSNLRWFSICSSSFGYGQRMQNLYGQWMQSFLETK